MPGRIKRPYLYGAIAIVAVVAAGVVVAVLVTRGPGAAGDGAAATQNRYDQAEDLQQRLSADSCSNSGASLENQLDGSRQIIYVCVFGSRKRCITVANGIARDATADVKRLYANAPPGTRRPGCAGA